MDLLRDSEKVSLICPNSLRVGILPMLKYVILRVSIQGLTLLMLCRLMYKPPPLTYFRCKRKGLYV